MTSEPHVLAFFIFTFLSVAGCKKALGRLRRESGNSVMIVSYLLSLSFEIIIFFLVECKRISPGQKVRE